MDNTSGQGKTAAVPAEVQRWNWGAFLLNWIWGIGNNTLIALLMFVPLVNLIMPFILGARGSAWAWQNKRWASVDEFRRVQRNWAIWGLVVDLLFVALFVSLVFGIMSVIKHSEAYTLGYQKLVHNQEAVRLLGKPIKAGFPMGEIKSSGPTGKADISFSVEGRKASGTVYVDAVKDMGKWRLRRAELAIEGRTGRINLNQ